MYKIICDVESTCCNNNEFPREEMEIIEIGAICLDYNNMEVGKFQSFIKPIKNPILTNFCKDLTTITQDEVNMASPFNVVMPQFLQWVNNNCKDGYEFYSWGDFDRNIFRRQCIEHNIDARRFLAVHNNAKKLFAEQYNCKPMGVSAALNYLRIKFDGVPHRALDDSINIAKLVRRIV